ncbi:MAG: hypothetical protein ACE5KK_05890 [Candidatus Brocadiales bacterium]
MNKKDISFLVSVFLLLAVSFTGTTGLIAHRLDLHQFWVHKYGAYTTLFLAFVHVCLNFRQLVSYARSRFSGEKALRLQS